MSGKEQLDITDEQRQSSKRLAWYLVALAMSFYIGFAVIEYIR